MEILLEKNFDHPNTQEKFELLKKLYQELTQNCPPADDFLSILAEHYSLSKNKAIISQHRGLHFPFFHKTKTEQMFEAFSKVCERKKFDP